MTDETKQAIGAKIALELEALQLDIHRYIAERSAGSNGPLALHGGFDLLKRQLIPKLVDDLIKYCLDAGLRDADVIAQQLQYGLSTRLTSLGQSSSTLVQSFTDQHAASCLVTLNQDLLVERAGSIIQCAM